MQAARFSGKPGLSSPLFTPSSPVVVVDTTNRLLKDPTDEQVAVSTSSFREWRWDRTSKTVTIFIHTTSHTYNVLYTQHRIDTTFHMYNPFSNQCFSPSTALFATISMKQRARPAVRGSAFACAQTGGLARSAT